MKKLYIKKNLFTLLCIMYNFSYHIILSCFTGASW